MRGLVATILFLFSVSYAGKRKTGETTYLLNFQEALSPCENFNNEVMDCTQLSMAQPEPSLSVLTGTISIKKPIQEGVTLVLSVFRETDMGREFFYMLECDVCEHISDTDTPWTPFFEALGITECPIEAKDYEITQLQLNLDFAKEVMKHEFVGDYYSTMAFQEPGEGIGLALTEMACYGMLVTVLETVEED